MTAFWQNRNVFVTGATGLLGSWLTQGLVERGANVTVLVRDHVPASNFSLLELDRSVNIVWGQLENYLLLERALTEYEIDSVFHLGAQTIVGVANQNPLSTFESNVKGTWCLLEACRRVSNVKRILVSTSDKAYGEQMRLPYEETMPLQGMHPYDVSKSCADLLSQTYHKSFGLPICVIRCANFFGGGDLNFNRLIPGAIRSVICNEAPVIRSDGKFIRDYLYVEDGVLGALQIVESLEEKNLAGEAFNLGMGLQMSALEVTELLLKLMKRPDLKPKILNHASNEIRRQYLSSKKIADRLGWRPKYDFEMSLKKTIAWYSDFFAKRLSNGRVLQR